MDKLKVIYDDKQNMEGLMIQKLLEVEGVSAVKPE